MSEDDGLRQLSDHLLFDQDRATVGMAVNLAASQCQSCNRTEFPIRMDCPKCGSNVNTIMLPTVAQVKGFTAVNFDAPGSQITAPYAVILGSFPQGVSVLGPAPDVSIHDLSINDEVKTVALDIGGRIDSDFNSQGRVVSGNGGSGDIY
jgi:uncharacterized OB-fold protein